MAAASAAVMDNVRPHVGGKFIYLGDQKYYVRGVTYGPFRPDADGGEYHSPDIVARDFAQMAANGLNAVRTYTVPPRWLLDAAQRHGLRVMVGLPWEQHVAFLDDPGRADAIAQHVCEGVSACGSRSWTPCASTCTSSVGNRSTRTSRACTTSRVTGRSSWRRSAWTAGA